MSYKWSVAKSGNPHFDLCVVSNEHGGSICHIAKWHDAKESADLIAAAPEMLDILIKAYRSNDHLGHANYHKWNSHFQYEVICILEKATGLSIQEITEGD